MPANITDRLVQEFQPDDPNVVIWRYMYFEQLLALVESKTLTFGSLEQYRGDKYEGHDTLAGRISSDNAGLSVSYEDFINTFVRKLTYVNCWTEGPAENAAFWEIKGTRKVAVAIRSTYTKLKNVLPDDYVIGKIKYINYNSEPGFLSARFSSRFPFFAHVYHKRLEYCYENEIRAARIPRFGSVENAPSADVAIPNLSDLIDAVYIRRSDHQRTKKRVENLCNRHKLNYKESGINDQPAQIRMSDEQRETLIKKMEALDLPKEAYEKMTRTVAVLWAIREAFDF